MHKGLDTAQYIRCLRLMYGLVAAWEERTVEIAPEWIRPTIVARQRRHLLELDLAWFCATEEDGSRPKLPPIDDLPNLVGSMYVMEGSTLGGQLIARHVETALHLREGHGNAYFRGHGDQTGPMWREFCEVLETRISDDQTDAVVAAAKVMFTTFGDWMRQMSVVDDN